MDFTGSGYSQSTNVPGKQEEGDISESNPILALARQAAEEGWTEQQIKTQVYNGFPEEVTLDVLLNAAGSVGDVATPRSVAGDIDRVISLLAERLDGDRKRGLVHVTLAGAWLIRAQIGGDLAGIKTARDHHAKAELLVPADGSSTYQALSMTGMLLSMLDPAGDIADDDDYEAQDQPEQLSDTDLDSAPHLPAGYSSEGPQRSLFGLDLGSLPVSASERLRLFEGLLNSDDKIAYIEEHLDAMDDDFLLMCNMMAEAAGQEGQYDFAAFLQAVAAHVETLREERQKKATPDEEAGRSPLAGWDLLAMLRHGRQAKRSADRPVRHTPAHPPIEEAPEEQQDTQTRQAHFQSEMDFLLEIVKASDDAEVEVLMDTRPSAWQPKLVRLMEQLEEVVEEEGQWIFAAKVKAARERVLRIRAARPLETALADIEVEETGRPTYELVQENPVLKSWEALERLGQWASLSHNLGDEQSASYYCMVICFLGRHFHADNARPDPRCAAWEAPLHLHLEQRRKDMLQQAIRAAATWTPPPAAPGVDAPLADGPSNLAALLAGWDEDDGELVERLGPLVEAGLWVRRLSMEALTVTLIEMDMIAHLAEYHVNYPLEHQSQMLEHGLQACDQAAELCEQIGLEAAAGQYLAVKGNGLFSVKQLGEAATSYQRAVDIFRKHADRQPDVYSAMWVRTLGNLANALVGQNRAEEALKHTKEAVDELEKIVQSVSGPEKEERQLDLVALWLAHATVQDATGEPVEALTTLGDAERLARELELERSDSRMRRDALAKVLNNEAVILTRGHRLDEAQVKMYGAATIWEQLRTEDEYEYGPTAADTLYNLGNIQVARRERKEALGLYTQALDIYTQLAEVKPDIYNPIRANLLTNMGIVLEDDNETEAAWYAYERAVALLEQPAEDAPDIHLPALTTALNNLGSFLSSQHRYKEAEPVLERALRLRKSLPRGAQRATGPYVAGILTNLGVVFRDTGRTKEARATLLEAIELDPDNRGEAKWRATQALARLERDTGNKQQAYELLREALHDLERIRGGLRHRQDLIGFHQTEFLAIYRQLVDLCLDLGWVEKAWSWAARSKGRTLLDLLSAGARPRLRSPEAVKRFQEWQDLEKEAASLEEQLNALGMISSGSQATSSQSLYTRAPVAVTPVLSPLQFTTNESEVEAKLQKLAQIREKADELQRVLLIELDEGDGSSGSREIDATDGAGSGRATPPSAEQLAFDLKALAQGTTTGHGGAVAESNKERGDVNRAMLVDYFMLGAGRYVVFLLPLWKVQPGQPLPLDHQVVQLGSEEAPFSTYQLVDLTMAALTAARHKMVKRTASPPYHGSIVRDYLREKWPSGASSDGTNADTGAVPRGITTPEELEEMARLGDALFGELPAIMGQALLHPWLHKLQSPPSEELPNELVLVPHTILHLLPLHAAALDEAGTPLIERYLVSYLPSVGMAGMLVKRRKTGNKPGGRLVLGPPDTSVAEAKAHGREFLEYAVHEAMVVAEQLGVAVEGQPIMGAAMVVERLRERAGNLQVLHLPTHSGFDFNDYLDSGIMFNDQVLTIFEILSDSSIDLSGLRLCYLSSCESGLAEVNAGDELQGLVWALTYAGAEAVMGTLWPVADRASSGISVSFYKACQAGATLREAWRTAVLEFRSENPGFSNPYFWAPFVLSGDAFDELD